jgi:hypothetical protein
VFGLPCSPWRPELQLVVEASWEWRREIAVRGRADAGVKARAVHLMVRLIREAPNGLWGLFGERWLEPEFHSLVAQPFLLSPLINVGDIACAFKLHPALGVEDALRWSHPFPIFERWVAQDVQVGGARVVRAGTQVIMFLQDLRPPGLAAAAALSAAAAAAELAAPDSAPASSSALWPPFGAGPRACAGSQLALALLRPIHSSLRLLTGFQPQVGHRYSGRHNDGKASLRESLYFARTVAPVVLGLRSGS